MKILSTLLLALSLSVNASENNNFEILKNDLKNTELYQSHYITITITKDENLGDLSNLSNNRVVEFVLNSPTGMSNSNLNSSYIDIISNNNESINQNNILINNLAIEINKLNDNQQTLTFSQKVLASFKELPMENQTTILPIVHANSWSMTITKDSMKKTWSDDLGNTYNLTYIGKKIAI